ncbi:heterokaryon incompatibility protein-domain-containing protein [Truncatella angustata]|uniref:Heterokaryon incompatibility protein-domain-containing protein n=1 Tax=Truncatella angustata TaxID=152316 RepID=A0A9P9A5L3_9PEZI|nr:heterokaryon incompatibility protein-domain-containing protein [Truncatella angustata]KAH6660964.1 heterokaryon incompatibility protein-domain-containing protein [Truncatella angustata]
MIIQAPKDEVADTEGESATTRKIEAIQRSMEPYLLFETVSELRESAKSECHFCTALATHIDSMPGRYLEADSAVYIECKPLEVPESLKFSAYLSRNILEEPDLDIDADWGWPQTVITLRQRNTDSDGEIMLPLAFRIEGPSGHWLSKDAGAYAAAIGLRQVSPIAGDVGTLRVVRKWLHECMKNEECSAWPKEAFRPTRLIDVGDDQTSTTMRLIEGPCKPEPTQQYVVLSYCWGQGTGQPTWITTTSNIQSRREGFSLEILPRTIADAVTVARAVGIRYLWVDSLCIVQDDLDDWAKESRLLKRVYTAAQFTIVSGTDSATSGLFIPRDELRVSAAHMTASPVTDSVKPHHVALFPLRTTFGKIHWEGPTRKRGWCLQEELLSPRRLYFTHSQFIWECVCSSHDETGTWSPGGGKDDEGYMIPPYPTDILTYSSKVIGEWYNIVEEYTSRSLTYHKDVFAALAGIAAGLMDKYEETFIAGLWEEDIFTGLLWRRTGYSLERPADFQAPSWSWLSVKGQVLFNRGDRTGVTPDAELIASHIETTDDDMFGEVLSGSLHIKARLLKCQVTQDGVADEQYKLHNTDQDLPVKITRQDPDSEYAVRSKAWEAPKHGVLMPPGGRIDLTACLKTGNCTFATIFFDGEEEAKIEKVQCAYIGVTERRDDTNDRNGIALVRVASDSVIPQYRRVGFVAFWDKMIKDDLESLLNIEPIELKIV